MKRRLGTLLCALALLIPCWTIADKAPDKAKSDSKTYKQEEIMKEAGAFFGKGAEGLAKVIAKVFKEQGEPNGFIKGTEGGGAVGVGLRYGKGTLQMHDGATMDVYWQGPSIGFDVGGNAAKAFVLIYKLDNTEKLFQRYPGVDGSLYFVGGVGLNYVRSEGTTLAPIRFGVGWRQGASVGYMHFTKKKSLNPF